MLILNLELAHLYMIHETLFFLRDLVTIAFFFLGISEILHNIPQLIKVIICDQLKNYPTYLPADFGIHQIRGFYFGGGACFDMKLHKYANIKTVGNSRIWIFSMN